MGWISLAEVFTPPSKVRDPKLQAELREQALSTGEVLLLRAISEGRLPGEEWRDEAACREPGKNELFFSQPIDPELAPEGKEAERVELERLARLKAACDTCESCPVYAQCLGWGLRIAGSDKDSIIAGITWNQRKQILAHLRLQAMGADDLLRLVGWKVRRLILRDTRTVALDGPEPASSLTERHRAVVNRGVKGVVFGAAPKPDVQPAYGPKKVAA